MSAAESLDQPAVVDDMDEASYHQHPALSSSGARKLLPPSCPAIFHHERLHPPEGKQVFDLGSAAHKVVLGAGPDVVVIDAPDWRTKGARKERDAARDAGSIPVLGHEWQQVVAMAEALEAHPVAAGLFAAGRAELSIFWRDDRSGVDCRARLDHLNGDMVTDYKTTASADPAAIAKSVANFGYHLQASWYMDAAVAVGLTDNPEFRFVCQSKTPPYPVTVVELDREALRVGAARNRRARSIYAECQATGVWPAHADGVVTVSLPGWATHDEAEEAPDEAEVSF